MLARVLAVVFLALLILIVVGFALLESDWAKNELRALIVRQANQYLTATLAIGRLEGSLTTGVRLGDVTLSRDGEAIVAIESVSLEYSVQEIWERGVVLRRIHLVRPRVVADKEEDGRWNLGALVRRDVRDEDRTGPLRPIELQSIEIDDATVLFRDPLAVGAAQLPTEFRSLNASMSFEYEAVQWALTLENVSWIGRAPDLTVTRLAGKLGHGEGGWVFDDLSVETPRSAFTLDGGVLTEARPTELDLHVRARRFAFQEWAGVLRGLKNLAVDAEFEATLKGPLRHLDTNIQLRGTGGDVSGRLTLDTTVPGWHGAGEVDVARINLARWLNRSDRPSEITGHVSFDLDLDLGRRFPRGAYVFDGAHAMFMDYAADDVRARGRLTASTVFVERATARAYGADVRAVAGTIGIDGPFPYRFQGTIAGLDLRLVPQSVPVPRVESRLAFDYDVTGTFTNPHIVARAEFDRSAFLGATIGAGTVGTLDTQAKPLRFGGDGEVIDLVLHRVGEGFDIAWLREPRYAGTISGRFRVDGTGTDAATLALTASGRLARATAFRGTVSEADVSLNIESGTLHTSFDGRFADVDPAIPFADPRFDASLTGSASVKTTVLDLLTRSPSLSDYDLSGRVELEPSTIRGVRLDKASLNGSLASEHVTLARAEVAGPALTAQGAGTIALGRDGASDFQYDITRADLAALAPVTGRSIAGIVATKGTLTGPVAALHAAGEATVNQLDAFGLNALTLTGRYDATVPAKDPAAVAGRIDGRGSFLTMFGRTVEEATGILSLASNRVGFDLTLRQTQGRRGQAAGSAILHDDRHGADLRDLTLRLGSSPWRLASTDAPSTVRWDDGGFAVSTLTLVGGATDREQITVSGTWRNDGNGALRVVGTNVFLETLEGALERPARYGGVMNVDATIRGTPDRPIVSGVVTVTDGRVARVTYERLAGRVDYSNRTFAVDFRLDQAPGVWLTAKGQVPVGETPHDAPDRHINVAIASSSIDLGLVEGLTDLVRGVSGQMRLNVTALGTMADPHFDGTIDVANAAFEVAATGVKYTNGSATLRLSTDRVTVDALHLEDEHNSPLDVRGSLATHELRVGDLAIDVVATRFEVIHNAFGRAEADGMLSMRGRLEEPRLTGDLTITGELRVDEILERALFQPYAIEPAAPTALDAVAALNPWNRLALDLRLRVPRTFRLTGTNVQVTPGTPIGLGDINLRVGGDLYFRKEPGQPVRITGSLGSISGTYAFQGRRFEIDEAASSIAFQGDLNPEISVAVRRVISGVETRLTIKGPLGRPELILSSTPPLDPGDILSLIVFNTTPNQLTTAQQQELAVRAGALAAGFLAAPLVAAIETELGIDVFEVEPAGSFGTGPRITIGEEIAPGLVARFSRQFGPEAFDEATVEYYLSQLLRLRATFSDAQSLTARTPFRRIERAGVDLLVFLSF